MGPAIARVSALAITLLACFCVAQASLIPLKAPSGAVPHECVIAPPPGASGLARSASVAPPATAAAAMNLQAVAGVQVSNRGVVVLQSLPGGHEHVIMNSCACSD